MRQRNKTYRLVFIFMIWLVNMGNAKNILSFQNIDTKLNVVIIDPGHGGQDLGANVAGIYEKNIVLEIGLKIGSYIEEAYPDVQVIYTRKDDSFISLKERARIANKNKADLFISIHANYVGVKSVSGAETFVLGNHRSEDNLQIAKKENAVILLEDNYIATYEGFDPTSSESYIMFEMVQGEYLDQSLQFASFIQDQFKNKAKRSDRGVKQAGFLVLRETTMPSVLIETGFLSNDDERKFMESETGKTNLATSIFRAFVNYKNIVEEKSKFKTNKEATALNVNSDMDENNSLKKEKTTAPDSNNVKKPDKNDAKSIPEQKTKVVQDKKIETVPNVANENKKVIVGNDIKIMPPTNSETEIIKPVQKPFLNNSEVTIEKEDNKSMQPQIPAQKIEKTPELDNKITHEKRIDIWFAVQVAVTSKQVKLIPDNFKGEENIFNFKFEDKYKYYKGKFESYDQAASEKEKLRIKFNDAFIVAFENGLPIPIKEAIQKTSK